MIRNEREKLAEGFMQDVGDTNPLHRADDLIRPGCGLIVVPPGGPLLELCLGPHSLALFLHALQHGLIFLVFIIQVHHVLAGFCSVAGVILSLSFLFSQFVDRADVSCGDFHHGSLECPAPERDLGCDDRCC